MFWNNKKLIEANEEFRKIIEDQRKRTLDLEMEFERLKSHQTSLRGLVNKKLKYPEEEEKDEPKEKEEKFINGGFVGIG